MKQKSFKQQLLNELHQSYKALISLPEGSPRETKVIFGEGDPNASLMIIGEAPGREEDLQGKPFVGRSGKLLIRTLNALGVERDEIFITNAVKCRPPQNRTPSPQEIANHKNILLQQIKIIQPTLVLTLGATATHALLEKPVQITKIRGTIQKKDSITILPTYHPAYILRNPAAIDHFINDIKFAIEKSQQ